MKYSELVEEYPLLVDVAQKTLEQVEMIAVEQSPTA